jgi:arginine decarboxylase
MVPIKIHLFTSNFKQHQQGKNWFRKSMEKNKYEAKYYYCYCTKSSHFEFIMNEAFKNNIHIETSSAFDINIVENLVANGKQKYLCDM